MSWPAGSGSVTMRSLRIWRNRGIQPHRTESFKFSTDPELEAKIIDIVGLYTNSPEGAIVLCIDEKPQIQALERSQPMLPVVSRGSSGARTTTADAGPPAYSPR